MVMISWNAERISKTMKHHIAKEFAHRSCNALCLQETHSGPNHKRPRIHSMKLTVEFKHKKHPYRHNSRKILSDIVILSLTIREV
jgi:exonuclease III